MRCKISFPVVGDLRLSASPIVPYRGWNYEFGRDEKGFVTSISIEAPANDPSQWPVIEPNPSPGVAARIANTEAPHGVFARSHATLLQGVLAHFGVERVSLSEATVEWIPESDEERSLLQLRSLKLGVQPIPRDEIPVTPFDCVARTVLALDRLDDLGVWSNMFRRGKLFMADQSFLDAIRHFYFMIESMLSNGKWRSKQVGAEIGKSRELVS